jgi:hypothetical protein
MANTIVGTIERVERLGTSIYGNPYFRVSIVTETGDVTILRTQIDSSISYAINNTEYRNVLHTFKLTEACRIYGAEKMGE